MSAVDHRRTHLTVETNLRRKDERAGGHTESQLQRRTASPTNSESAASADGHNLSVTSSASTNEPSNNRLSSSERSALSTTGTSTMSEDDRSPPKPHNAHAQPKTTILDLVTNTATSSALSDSFGFSVSRKGAFIAVYTASNIWLINAPALPRLFARVLSIRRRPVALDILDDGKLLAVLSTPTKVDVYTLSGQGERIDKHRTILLENEATTVVLCPNGLVLATGHKYGIEVVSIAPNAAGNSRRSVTCSTMDCLEFSNDGRTLLATSCARKSGVSTVFTVHSSFDGPFTEEGEPIVQEADIAWTTQILFPERARKARQATFIPDSNTAQINELFAFDADDDCWGIYDLSSTTFTEKKTFLPDQQRWIRSEFLDEAIPAVSPDAHHVAVALRMQNSTSLWLYRLPDNYMEDQRYEADDEHGEDQTPLLPCSCFPILQDNHSAHQEISAIRWLKVPEQPEVERLVAVGNMTFADTTSGPIPAMPRGSSGVVVVLDFDNAKPDSNEAPVPQRMTFDLDALLPAEKLPEEDIEFETEVQLLRTRTVAQRRAEDRAAARSRTSRALSRSQTTGSADSRDNANDQPPRPNVPTIVRDDEETLEEEEAQAVFEAPYDHSQPRSQSSLQRAATVAAVSPANRRHLRALPFRPLEYRRADGMREFPHESDADNWVPPPPPYTPNADPPGAPGANISLSHPIPPVPPVPSLPPIPTVPALPAVPPLQPITSPNGTRYIPAASTTNLPSPPSQLNQPYLQYTTIQTQSTSDLANLLAASSRPTLLHPSTYPAPQPPSPGDSPQARRQSRSGSGSSPTRRRRRSSRSRPEQQSAYQSPSTRHHQSRPSRTNPPNRDPLATYPSAQPLPPLPPFASRQSSRRGSAPDTNHVQRRPVPRDAGVNRMSVPNPQAQQRTRRPLLSIPRSGQRAAGEPLSAPPGTQGSTLRGPSRLTVRTDAEGGEAPGKRGLKCVVM